MMGWAERVGWWFSGQAQQNSKGAKDSKLLERAWCPAEQGGKWNPKGVDQFSEVTVRTKRTENS